MLGCLVCLIIQGYKCIDRYLKRDSRVIQNLKASKDVLFIAFTICPSFLDAYNETMLEVHGTNKSNYKGGTYYIHSGQKCLPRVACLWSKMPMLQRAGMREGGEPILLAFQYLIMI